MGIDPKNENTEIKQISVEEFAELDFSKVTLLDLRDEDEVLTSSIEGAIHIPFAQIGSRLSTVPADLPVYVYCTGGVWSEEVTEILTERGYDAYNVAGGFETYRAYIASRKPVEIDAKELKCPGPIVKVADSIRQLKEGQTLIVEASEDAFASDIQIWCDRTGNELTSLKAAPGNVRAEIIKGSHKAPPVSAPVQNDKTFVVFSGDLDKTIAAFIIANGAAAMGRNVTIFFTFWGLNILRRPEKIKVAKPLIGRIFGVMMPRGTRRLGLSRMNMGGAGARMIRGIMKQKGVLSFEELIDSAKAHGVKLVACQMSMDIMGIRREELIDGVEIGGVATFLGAGEQSDMSLFI